MDSIFADHPYSIKFICNPQISDLGFFMVNHGHGQSSKSLSHLTCTFPAQVGQRDALPSYFSSHTVKKYSFCGLFNVTFFCDFFFVISCLKWLRAGV